MKYHNSLSNVSINDRTTLQENLYIKWNIMLNQYKVINI